MTNPKAHTIPDRPWHKIYKQMGATIPEKDDRPLAAHIDRHAKERPEAPALLYFDKVFSYSEYRAEVNKLANVFKGLGLKKGDTVGMLMPNIPQYAIAVAACTRIGAIGTGLSPLSSPSELAYQIQDSGTNCVIALSDLMPKITAIGDMPGCLSSVIMTSALDYIKPADFDLAEIVNVETLAYNAVVPLASDECVQTPHHWNDTFMVQYTGGTTGRPKGAQLSIRNIMHNTAVNRPIWGKTEIGKEVYASPFPLFHIAGLYGLAFCVRLGGLFFLQPDPRNLPQLVEYMKKFPPTLVGAVPALTEMLLANPDFQALDFSALHTWGSGAAPISKETVAQLVGCIGVQKLSDAFGMTETCGAYVGNPTKNYKFGSVGIPALETDVKIMDVETGTVEMPTGEPGEICASGPQVMKGYLNLPEESANALRDIDGKTYMYSGDVGYMDEEGYLFLCDRAKDMLIVGGFKVFSVEIEDNLSSLDFVSSSAVVGQPDTSRPGNDIVNLFVQLSEPHKDRDEDEVRSEIMGYFAKNMAVYKKPKAIHFVDEIPLTPIGKIDKKALRASLNAN